MESTFQVTGMTCRHCVQAVSAEVGALPGVESVAVDLATGTVTVHSQVPVPVGQVRAAVDEAGYQLVGRRAQSGPARWPAAGGSRVLVR